MDWLKQRIDTIQSLLNTNSEAKLAYAGLEARLTLELLVYRRLRVAHDYISPKDLRRWQPKDVINILINEVDPYVATTRTLSMAPETTPGKISENPQFQVVGTQIGFDHAQIGKLWNALSSFLHVQLPKDSKTELHVYNDVNKFRLKIIEVMEFLKPLEKASLEFSGFGSTVSFECDCGSFNRRRSNLLKHNQVIQCINPQCENSFRVEIENEEINFLKELIELDCSNCGSQFSFKARPLVQLSRDVVAHSDCAECGKTNYFQWRLCQVEKVDDKKD